MLAPPGMGTPGGGETKGKIVRRWIGRLLVMALVVALAAPLAACGLKSSPQHPAGSDYPRKYPKE